MSVLSPTDAAPTSFEQDWEAWHAAHERRRADRHGFLAVSSITRLTDRPQRLADAPGAWSSTPLGGPVVELDEGEFLIVDGARVTGRHSFGVIPERGGITAYTGRREDAETAAIEVARRGGGDIVRPRHPGHPVRAEYRGTAAFPPRSAWRIEGSFFPFETPRDVTVGSVTEGLQHVYAAPGVIEFAHDGATHRLTAFNGLVPGSLLVLFTDATSGVSTYAANRSLNVDAPEPDRRVLLDFNRATNLPCAYTPFATCPLPPLGNRLPFAVEAGEKCPA